MNDVTRDLDWIELVLGFACNCRCKACPSAIHSGGDAMTSREIAGWLRRGRDLGASGVWFGGGEPTLHPNLVAAVGRARELGYQRIRIQSNGLRFAYPEFAEKIIGAGANEFSLPILDADEAAYNAFTRDDRSFELLIRGLGNLNQLGVGLEGDVLITAQNAGRLEQAVQRFAGLGLTAFTFWLVSMHGLDPPAHAHRVPAMSALVPELLGAMDAADSLGASAVSLHTPPCVLPSSHRGRYRHAGHWRLLVATPGAEPFMTETSPMEGGVFLDGCGECSWRSRCLGLRADYLEIHGPGGVDPIA